MATQPQTGLTYEDLQAFPEDNLRRELIDGELIVTAAPVRRHQQAVASLMLELGLWAREHGGEVLSAPFDVVFSEADVVEPDVLFVKSENLSRFDPRFLPAPPDLAVEVSSPSTRRVDAVRKLELYERFGVPEYWIVDLDADRFEVYRLDAGGYAKPLLFGRGDVLESPMVPGLTLAIDEVLGPPEED